MGDCDWQKVFDKFNHYFYFLLTHSLPTMLPHNLSSKNQPILLGLAEISFGSFIPSIYDSSISSSTVLFIYTFMRILLIDYDVYCFVTHWVKVLSLQIESQASYR